MGSAPERRFLVAWLALVAITLGYALLEASDRASAAITTAAILLALLKVRVIFREFMEVRHAPVLLSRATDLCIALMAAAMVGSYAIGRAVN